MLLLRLLKGIGRAPAPPPAHDGDPLARWFFGHTGRLVHKWHHYFEIYHRHFARYRGRSPVVLEVGLFHGGSLEMWREYFGPGVRLFGIDVDPRCRAFADADATILIGDQADRAFLAEVRRQVPRIDVLIDDGGHRMHQQLATFAELYPHVADDGVYLCEDLHTSYWGSHGGGYRRPGTFVEFSKGLVDQLNAWHSREPGEFRPDEFTRTTWSMHYYDSVLVIEKRPMRPPQDSKQGTPSF
jgi:SAM-dependent methyltransferase